MSLKMCERSGRRFLPYQPHGKLLQAAREFDRKTQKDQGGTKMEPYSTYANIVFFFAIVGLFSFVYMSCDIACKVMKWLTTRKRQ